MNVGPQESANCSPMHPIDYLVDSAVAAQHQDQVRAFANRLLRQLRRVAGFIGRNETRPKTRATKCVSGTL